jgi:hypothetical protein
LTRIRRAPPERVDEPLRWLKANGHDLAPVTGTDTRALLAIAACWRLYFNADDQHSVIVAVVALLRSLQPKCWRLAKALIPWAGDWSHEAPVWLQVLEVNQHARAAEELGARARLLVGDSTRVDLERDPSQCRGDSPDGAPCRRDAVAGAELCADHLRERSSCSASACGPAWSDDSTAPPRPP